MRPEVANATNASDTYIQEFDYELVHSIVIVVVPLFFGIIGILGFAGNSLVIVVVAANPGMKSTTNILIINLAIADLLFVIFCIPFTATDFVLPYWPFGNLWCKTVQYLIIVTAYASVYTLVLMSLDRYLAVVHPIASMSWRTENHAIQAICMMWVWILAVSIPAFMIHGEHPNGQSENLTVCRILEDQYRTVFQVTFFLTSYVLPLVLICIFYMSMLIRLWRNARASAESQRGRRRATRLVCVVVGVFAVCWCPIQVILVTKSLEAFPLTTTTIMIQIVSHILAYTNSCVNPFLYAFLSDHFRKAFRKIIYYRPRAEVNDRLGPQTKTRTTNSGDIL
ncbi:allatostatin-A receptor isoform X2 [Temnothorax nylanderi]|uniref:allatostatin-A receptor isoform X2 n=1 Tax=Temnothorax nylanderi TaxID=102681 RepID=UPI003A83EEFC